MLSFTNYQPHLGQIAFHYAIENLYRFVAMITGIRGGKTYAGAREAGRQSFNAEGPGVYGIIAPTFHMLKRTTWAEYGAAMAPLILQNSKTDMIITLKNGREVHGFSADKPDRIRNATLCGFWLDEGRECKDGIWDILLGRVLSTGGKGILTTSPNSFDWIHREFIEQGDRDYGVVRFSTYDNSYIKRDAIESLERKYDPKFAEQELHGGFVLFQGAVYYTFSRNHNAGDIAFRVANYRDDLPLCLCWDFNVDPMSLVIAQVHTNSQSKLPEIMAIDEIVVRNSNTIQVCQEFKTRYPNHKAGIILYGDATGEARHADSNITNWKIIENELRAYGCTKRVPSKNPAERDRINAVNGMICNSKQERRVFVNPNKCKKLITDFEQVAYKEGTSHIDKGKDLMLTHPSDGFGYMVEREFSINRAKYGALKI